MAKDSMKDRMAKMRAAKAAKSGAPKAKKPEPAAAKPTASKPPVTAKADTPVAAAPAQPEKQKSWKLGSMADFSKLPREQVTYVMFYMKTEILRAIVHGKVIDHFVWTEGQKLVTKYVEDAAEAFE